MTDAEIAHRLCRAFKVTGRTTTGGKRKKQWHGNKKAAHRDPPDYFPVLSNPASYSAQRNATATSDLWADLLVRRKHPHDPNGHLNP
jgi:hypothetical protein